MYWRNPLHDNIEGILALAVANEDTNEADNAAKIAIKKLARVEAADLQKLSTILVRVARLETSWPGALDKLRDIVAEASSKNNLLDQLGEIQPPQPTTLAAPAYDFESEMADMARRTVWEAHEEAGREYSYENYRHPWKQWQQDRDKEDRDAGYEWFADQEQGSWADQLHEQSQTAPWKVWSRGIGPAEIFQLLEDLLEEQHHGGALMGLSNLHWPNYESIRDYVMSSVPINRLATIAPAFYAAFELHDKYWIINTLLRLKLAGEQTPQAVDALHQWIQVEEGIQDCCQQSRRVLDIGSVLNTWEWQVHPVIINDYFQALSQALRAAQGCNNECVVGLLESLDGLTEHQNPAVSVAASQLVIGLLADNIIDIRDAEWIDIQPDIIYSSEEWQLLEQAVADMKSYTQQPSAWKALWQPFGRYIKIAQLASEPLPRLIPLLAVATRAVEDAADFRLEHLYKDYASSSSARRTWHPSDRDLQQAAVVIAQNLIPEDSRSLELFHRLVEAVLLHNTSTQDINTGTRLLRALSQFPAHQGAWLAELIFASFGNNRKLDWLIKAYQPQE